MRVNGSEASYIWGEIHVLNVAGPRASKEPTVAEFVTATLDDTFGEEVKR